MNLSWNGKELQSKIRVGNGDLPKLALSHIQLDTLCITLARKDLSKFNGLVVSAVEGMTTVKDALGKVDFGFVSAFTTDPVKGKKDSVSLANDLRANGFQILRFLGHYEYTDDDGNRQGGDEWSFGVVNNGMSTAGFLNFLIQLGNSYGQQSILFCPAQDFVLKSDTLQGKHGYWFFLKAASEPEGSYQDKGMVTGRSVEEWAKWVAEMTTEKETVGWTRTSGTDEVLHFDDGEVSPKVWNFRLVAVSFDQLGDYFPGRLAWNVIENRKKFDRPTNSSTD